MLNIGGSLRLVLNTKFPLLTAIELLGLVRHTPLVPHLNILQRLLRVHFLKHHVIMRCVLIVFIILNLLTKFFRVFYRLILYCHRERFFVDSYQLLPDYYPNGFAKCYVFFIESAVTNVLNSHPI